MNVRIWRVLLPVVIVGVLAFLPSANTSSVQAFDYDHLSVIQKRLLSGFAELQLNEGAAAQRNAATRLGNFRPTGDDGCAQRLHNDVKVNQDCLNLSDPDLQGRAQAHNETAITQDPLHPDHLLAGFNDYRRGDGNCYGAYSLDGGKHWSDTTIPMGFTRGTAFGAAREYWQAGGDTAAAWDTKGNAYFQCQVFLRGKPTSPNPDQSSAVYVFRSTGNFGASWNFPGRSVIESNDVADTGLPAFEDKPYMAVDNHVGSRFQDRVYVTYTEFAADGTAYIWEAYSADYGEHFSKRVLVSGPSAILCPNSVTAKGNCDANQFSQPFTGADGDLYVAYANFNNAIEGKDNRNQMLLARSTDGGATFGAPVKVADYYDLPDCATYQGGKDPGRACVPEKGGTSNSIFRAANYPAGAADPTNAKRVVVTFGSYINAHSKEANGCTPAGLAANGDNLYTGVKAAAACNNDILLSISNDGGATFTGAATDPRELTSVTGAGEKATDQWWQWAAFTKEGRLAVSYYDRRYGDDETTGFSDISLSGSTDLAAFGVKRVTGASMPPPTQFGGVFLGDYTGLTAVEEAHPIWMDTRNADLFLCPGTGVVGTPPRACSSTDVDGVTANQQDVFTVALAVPEQPAAAATSPPAAAPAGRPTVPAPNAPVAPAGGGIPNPIPAGR